MEEVYEQVLAQIILLIFIPPIYNTIFMLVREKESRIKETMRMMGMSDLAYWLSWYVSYTFITILVAILATLVLMINVIEYTNPLIILFLLVCYAQAIFAQIAVMAALFENSKNSGLVGTLVYFGLSLVAFPITGELVPEVIKVSFSIIPQVALSLVCTIFARLESNKIGMNFENANNIIENYSYTLGIVMLLASFVVFLLFAFYLDAVLPKTFGEQKPACFCFTCCCKKKRPEAIDSDEGESLKRYNTIRSISNKGEPGEQSRRKTLTDPFELKYLDKRNYEGVAPEVAALELNHEHLQIKDLEKVYPNGYKAVQGINLKMYKGQIFSLLGHNGAGKSTTISMLTGLLDKSSGSGQVFGNDIFRNMKEARKSMGVCPQHDVLFDLLTPLEHLDIFYDFKGGDPDRKE